MDRGTLNETLIVAGAAVAIAAAVVVALVVTRNDSASNNGAASAARADPGAGGNAPPDGMLGGPPMGMPPFAMDTFAGRPENTVAVATSEHLFITQGSSVYKLNIDSLEIVSQQDLPQLDDASPVDQIDDPRM